MNVVELFAGAGGAYLGLHRAGLSCLCAVEWDKSAAATLAAVGAPVMHGDVRDLDRIAGYVDGRPVDALWSSFPCQAWSSAGKRLGAKDARNGWPWTVDAIDRFRPTWFLAENVVGLTHHRGGCARPSPGQARLFGSYDPSDCPGCYLDWVILADLRARFPAFGWWEIDAADLGVPQHRRRIIIWAGPVAPAKPASTHGPGRALPWVSMGEALGLEANLYAYFQWNPETAKGGNVWIPVTDPSQTLNCIGCVTVSPTPIAGPNGLQVRSLKAGANAVDGHLARPSPTVTAAGELRGSGPGGSPEKMQRASDALYLATAGTDAERRRLTWQECAILQAFPADWPFQGGVGDRYRQIGNAVAPPVAEAVGRAILAAAGGGR